MSALPLVSIGLPVYNGMPYLREAVESLLKQTYANLEIIISDNASTDATGDYCRALAQVHPRVRYQRNAQNVGPYENFRLALARARGELFMWASHDDKWSDRFVSALIETLAGRPDAVLATPAVIHLRTDGTLASEPPDRPATGQSGIANLKLLYDDHGDAWLYGLWRTEWLRAHFHEYLDFPFWSASVLWLADVCLRCPVVGNQEAVIFKRWLPSPHAPRSARASVAFWISMFWHLSRISIRRTSGLAERGLVLALSWRYVYRLCIRRPYLLRTLWRVVRMVSIAALASLLLGTAYLLRRLVRGLPSAVDFAVRRPI